MIRMFSIKNCLFFGRLFPLESSGSLDILEFHRDQVSFPFFNPSCKDNVATYGNFEVKFPSFIRS